MSERYEPYRPTASRSPEQAGPGAEPDDWREQTTPGITPIPHPYGTDATAAHPAAGGYPRAGDYGPGGTLTAPDYAAQPVAVRRPDGLAALLLVLAGIATGVSLLLPWVRTGKVTGWDLMGLARTQLASGAGEIFRTGVWQPVAVVLGGALLFLLGLLLFVPARSHRFLGVLALLAALVAGAGVLVAVSGTHWQLRRFDVGFWFAAAVPVLGVLGALKALLTGPRAGARR